MASKWSQVASPRRLRSEKSPRKHARPKVSIPPGLFFQFLKRFWDPKAVQNRSQTAPKSIIKRFQKQHQKRSGFEGDFDLIFLEFWSLRGSENPSKRCEGCSKLDFVIPFLSLNTKPRPQPKNKNKNIQTYI